MFKKYDSRRQFVARRASNKTIKIIISDYDKSQEYWEQQSEDEEDDEATEQT